jgi:L-ascorbate metabolism protein UlaG (beta-lactamase superfamily)
MPTLNRGFALTWLGHGTFKLVTKSGKTVLLDPWVEGNPACPQDQKTFDGLDVITISHGHGDHMGDAVTLGKKFKPAVICMPEIGSFLKKKGVTNIMGMNKGGTVEAAGIRFTMVHALHSSGIEDGGEMIYGGEAAGFVVTLEDGTRIYHAGDTGVFSEMALIGELYAPDISLLPIGDHYTMSPKEAALAARMLKSKWIVPEHFGTFPVLTGTPDQLKDEMKKLGVTSEVVALEPGEALT